MTAFIQQITEEVSRAAKRIHGSNSTRLTYQTALVAELMAAGLPVRVDVTFPENYDDVDVCHCLDLIVGSHLCVVLRSAAEILPNHCYSALLEFYLRKAGLSYGLMLDFTGKDLQIVPVSLSAAHSLCG